MLRGAVMLCDVLCRRAVLVLHIVCVDVLCVDRRCLPGLYGCVVSCAFAVL